MNKINNILFGVVLVASSVLFAMEKVSSLTGEQLFRLGMAMDQKSKDAPTAELHDALLEKRNCYFQQAAKEGYAPALREMAIILKDYSDSTEDGQEKEECFQQAHTMLILAAVKGDAEANFELGMISAELAACEENVEKRAKIYMGAIAWFEKSAEQGFALAHYNVAKLCMVNLAFSPAEQHEELLKKAIARAEKAIMLDDSAEAYLLLGNAYSSLVSKTKKGDMFDLMVKAEKSYIKASEKGSASAQYLLGMLYECSVEAGDDPEKKNKALTTAFLYYRMAAEQDYAEAQYRLALKYKSDSARASEQDEKELLLQESKYWSARADKQGKNEALTTVGVTVRLKSNLSGDHREKRFLSREAIKLFRKAAQLGLAGAQENLDEAIKQREEQERICAKCGAARAMSKCGSCMSVNYCNKECQKIHWAEHKQLCNKVRSKTEATTDK